MKCVPRTCLMGLLALGCPSKEDPPAAELAEKAERLVAEAQVRVRHGRHGDAENLYVNALKLMPDDTRALSGMAAVRLSQGQLDEARKLIERALHGGSEVPEHHALHGRILASLGEFAPSAQAFENAFIHAPQEAQYAVLGGEQRIASNQFAAAEALFLRAIEVDPDIESDGHSGVYTLLGDVLSPQKRLDDALRAYMKAQSIHASDKRAYAGAATVYEAMGKTQHAIDQWSAYIRMDCCSAFSNDVAKKRLLELQPVAAPR